MASRHLARLVLKIKQWEAPGLAGCFPLFYSHTDLVDSLQFLFGHDVVNEQLQGGFGW